METLTIYTETPEALQKARTMLAEMEDVWFEDEKPLTAAQHAAIERGYADMVAGRTITFEDFKKSYPEWPTK